MPMTPGTDPGSYWAVMHKSEIQGVWVGHALDFDIVSQGYTLYHAMEVLREVVQWVIKSDEAAGFNSHDRKAPFRYWNELFDLDLRSHRVDEKRLQQISDWNEDLIVTCIMDVEGSGRRVVQVCAAAPIPNIMLS